MVKIVIGVDVMDIREYLSPERVSTRILLQAKSLAKGNDEYAECMKHSVILGFEEARKELGGKLPDISKQTYKITIKKFDEWIRQKNNS